MLEFKKYIEKIEEANTVGHHNDGPGSGFNNQISGGAYLSTDWSGTDAASKMLGNPLNLAGTDIEIPSTIPTISKTAQIQFVEKKQNPIFVLLSDGTRLYFTLDEFNRIPGKEPVVGRTMKVKFQRNPKDKSLQPSQIQHCEVI